MPICRISMPCSKGHALKHLLRKTRMIFNWVLWRYTILYINERSWESGGVVRGPR